MDRDRLLSSYDYHLPPEQIAQVPVVPRDRSRLLVLDGPQSCQHARFYDLGRWVRPGDLLVLNDTRVLPARLYGQKTTGAAVELLLLERQDAGSAPPSEQAETWLALVKPGRRLPVGTEIAIAPEASGLRATVVDRESETGGRLVRFDVPVGKTFAELLEQCGEMPLPPYVTSREADPQQYQTVYAAREGAIAAPTAGLHFTPELLAQLRESGVRQANVTLHVGIGTFRPVESEDITAHAMHAEWVEVPAATVAQIEQTKAASGRVFAVGTTVVRSLEGAAAAGKLAPFTGKTDLFIYPGYRPRVVDGLITNFHLPKSSLLMLVSAFIGRTRLLSAYEAAIAAGYRFYSFGDAMLILPESCLAR